MRGTNRGPRIVPSFPHPLTETPHWRCSTTPPCQPEMTNDWSGCGVMGLPVTGGNCPSLRIPGNLALAPLEVGTGLPSTPRRSFDFVGSAALQQTGVS